MLRRTPGSVYRRKRCKECHGGSQEHSLIQRRPCFTFFFLCHRQVTTHVCEFVLMAPVGDSARNLHKSSYNLLINSLHCKIFSLSHRRLCHLLIKDQAKELTRLNEKLRKGRDVSQLLDKHLEDLLSHDDPEHCQRQGFQEQLAEGRRLAKCLARTLSSGKAATGPDCTELLQGPGLTGDFPPALTLLVAAVLSSPSCARP